jgi:hypothetical protein
MGDSFEVADHQKRTWPALLTCHLRANCGPLQMKTETMLALMRERQGHRVSILRAEREQCRAARVDTGSVPASWVRVD